MVQKPLPTEHRHEHFSIWHFYLNKVFIIFVVQLLNNICLCAIIFHCSNQICEVIHFLLKFFFFSCIALKKGLFLIYFYWLFIKCVSINLIFEICLNQSRSLKAVFNFIMIFVFGQYLWGNVLLAAGLETGSKFQSHCNSII